ncbi:hypothetical protein HQ524_04055 [Candidatus Uhrbacteria bacterium]|nr:hypothetical protein [Candidatus Uhrbacteria bacterium]
MGIKREDYTGDIQLTRGKQNIRYERDGESAFAKIVTTHDGSRENLTRLKREKHALDKLRDTGIVPKVISFKEYGEDKARLLLEELPGESFDHMPWQERAKFAKQHAQEIVSETGKSLHKIHNSGVFVVDVNVGTFLFDAEADDALGVHVLDLELAHDADSDDEESLRDSIDHFKRNDLGFTLAKQEGTTLPEDEELLMKAELYRWAKTMKKILIHRYPELEIPTSKQEQLEAYLERIRPVLEEDLIRKAGGLFKRVQARGNEQDVNVIARGLEDFSSNYIKKNIDNALNGASSDFNFTELCEANGIDLPVQYSEFISQCLSMDIDSRPDSFEELIQQ